MADAIRLYINHSGLRHDTGPGHPERPARLQALIDLFDRPPFDRMPQGPAREAEFEELLLAHDRSYVERLEDATPDRGLRVLDGGDTTISPGSYQAALYAAGAVCQAVEDVVGGKTRAAFCALRPPGHHAFPGHAEGFCLFNNVMIGALHAQAGGKIKRVAIVDFDVHHGNGTDAMARMHTDIFYASTHQWPLYPGTGTGKDDIEGKIMNIPLSAGDGSERFRAAWGEIFPAIEAFKPELLMISAGFDAHKNEPLAGIKLDEDDFRWITKELVRIADTHCEGRIVSVLEGGYDIDALVSCTDVHVRVLAGI